MRTETGLWKVSLADEFLINNHKFKMIRGKNKKRHEDCYESSSAGSSGSSSPTLNMRRSARMAIEERTRFLFNSV